MKLNLTIELDWIDEESNLDDTVKKQVIESVVSRVQKTVLEATEKDINKMIDETVIDSINKKTDEVFNGFLNRSVSITDKYGSKIEVYDNIEALIKHRFDNWMVAKVDDKGNPKMDGYGTSHKRIDFIVRKQLVDFGKKFTQEAVETVSKEIKELVGEGLSKKMGEELMKVLKVNEMLGIPAPSKKR